MIYLFDHPHQTDPTALIGGKGRSLWAMTGMGLPVPPGFTLPISADWSMDEVRDGLNHIGKTLAASLATLMRPY